MPIIWPVSYNGPRRLTTVPKGKDKSRSTLPPGHRSTQPPGPPAFSRHPGSGSPSTRAGQERPHWAPQGQTDSRSCDMGAEEQQGCRPAPAAAVSRPLPPPEGKEANRHSQPSGSWEPSVPSSCFCIPTTRQRRGGAPAEEGMFHSLQRGPGPSPKLQIRGKLRAVQPSAASLGNPQALWLSGVTKPDWGALSRAAQEGGHEGARPRSLPLGRVAERAPSCRVLSHIRCPRQTVCPAQG